MASTGGSSSTRQTRVSAAAAAAIKAEKTVVKASASVENTVSSTQGAGKSSSRREVLIRQPSYCKILDDLKGAEAKVANMKQEASEGAGAVEVGTESESESGEALSQQQVQTITINGQQYQIVSPIGVDGVQTIVAASGSGGSTSTSAAAAPVNSSAAVVQYAASTQNGQTVFIPGTVAAASASSPQIISVATASPPSSASGAGSSVEEQTRKREIRLLKNREAARECRNKKKEYIKCLENRVGKWSSFDGHWPLILSCCLFSYIGKSEQSIDRRTQVPERTLHWTEKLNHYIAFKRFKTNFPISESVCIVVVSTDFTHQIMII